MYSKKHLTKYKDYVIQPYYHSHQQPDKQWGYRVWDLQVINCPTVSQNFRAKPRRVVVSLDRATPTVGQFIFWIFLWKGYELMCVDEIGCQSSKEAVKAAMQEVDKGFHHEFKLKS